MAGRRGRSSVAGGPVGEHASTVTTNADILSYSRTRGLFAGTNLDGSAITEDEVAALKAMIEELKKKVEKKDK